MGPRAYTIMTIVGQVWRFDAVKLCRSRALRFVIAIPAALSLALLISGADAAPADDFAKLLHDYDEAQLELFPSLAIARNEQRRLGRYEDTLTPEHLAKARRLNAEQRARLAAIDKSGLGTQDRLSYDIFAWTLARRAEELAPGQGEMRQMLALDQFNGAHLSFAREIAWHGQYPYTNVPDYERAITRMQGFAHFLDTAIVRMREGIAKHIVLPRVVVERMIPQLEQFVAPDSEASLFMGPAKNIPKHIRPADRARIAATWSRTVREAMLPAYRRLLAFLRDEYLSRARTTIGLIALPGGRQMYLDEVRERTTLDVAPPHLFALGQNEVARIEAAMERAKAEAGFSGTLAQFKAYLRTDPRFKFANPAAMLAAFEHARGIVAARLASQFGRVPKARLEFRTYEAFLAPTKSAAEYSALSADGRRPGIVYINAFNLAARPTYTTDALELHEGVPGHHLQAAIAMTNASLPYFRRFGGPSAFTEGWAQYAESLGPALGLYRTPFQKFGALAYDAWRSARLVVDTGIHWKGWDKAMAVQFLIAHTALAPSEAETEVERYIAVPAQALAYKVGETKFLELRRHAQSASGRRFDVRRFHDELLKDGAMPLPILEAKMAHWLAAETAR